MKVNVYLSLVFQSTLYYMTVIASVPSVAARKWADSGTGAIALEEAWTIPELLYQIQCVLYDSF
jgi:hypothetical protein